jgi:xanthine dehydrogenase accessory factor
MRDILPDIGRWYEEHKSIALATVVQTWGSSPRRPGAKMAITLDGGIAGSVSGGCVESAVIEAAVDSLKTKEPRLLHFGVADETAWEVGLACGGSIDIFVKPLDPDFFESVRSTLRDEQEAVAVTMISGPPEILGREMLVLEGRRVAGAPVAEWYEAVLKLAAETLSQGTSRRARLNGSAEVFLEMISAPPTLIAVGGVHVAVALMSLSKKMGYRTIIIDPRRAWGNADRFPNVDQLVQAWPDDAFRQIRVTHSSAIAMLTHDPKLDDPALKVALASPAFYVGALGSKSTQAKRRERLLNDGLTRSQLARLHAPIGLDIGAESPEEIALAIMAQVVEARRRPEPSPV